MKVKNEVKIAIVAILGIIILFFGMQFLKGSSLFSTDNIYNIKFDNISGLSTSSPIYSNGFKVGTVKGIEYDYKNNKDIIVKVAIDKNMTIPQGTRAEINSDMLGNVRVNLLLGSSTAALKPGGVINGGKSAGMMEQVAKLVPPIQAMMPKLDSIMTNLNMLTADPALKSSLHNVDRLTASLVVSSAQLNLLLSKVSKDIPGMTGKTNLLLDNAGGTMKSAHLLVNNINQKIDSIHVTQSMAKLEQTLHNVQELTRKLNEDEGTLGMLMNDKQLYLNLTKTIGDLDSLMIDLKAHPKRYVHFSVF
jgi:phospholipid/cholesterol/gamma-HCH transport system substrate-binding protein